MNDNTISMNSVFSITNTQKILEYLVKFPGEQFLASEIQNKVKMSKGGVNQSLRELATDGLVNREKRGKIFLYSISHVNPIVKQYKILKNIELLKPLINKIGKESEKVILFGSSARGEDTSDSDLDVFVLTKVPDEINNILKKYRLQRKLQFIVRTSVNYMNMEKKEPVLFEEINRGIILSERKE